MERAWPGDLLPWPTAMGYNIIEVERQDGQSSGPPISPDLPCGRRGTRLTRIYISDSERTDAISFTAGGFVGFINI